MPSARHIATYLGLLFLTVEAVPLAAQTEKEEEERRTRQAKQKGEQEADARNAIKLEKLRDEIANILRTIEVRENFLVTAFAVGICAANADHNICDEEREEIETLVELQMVFGLI